MLKKRPRLLACGGGIRISEGSTRAEWDSQVHGELLRNILRYDFVVCGFSPRRWTVPRHLRYTAAFAIAPSFGARDAMSARTPGRLPDLRSRTGKKAWDERGAGSLVASDASVSTPYPLRPVRPLPSCSGALPRRPALVEAAEVHAEVAVRLIMMIIHSITATCYSVLLLLL